jgi:FOG: Ankyrin repeat
LVNAASVKNYAVAQLLRESIDLEEMIRSRGQNQELLLLVAAACGWDDMVRQLLDQGCPVDTKVRNSYSFNSTSKPDIDKQHLPAISLAADRGHYSTVQLLLSYNANYNPPWRYEEPFPLLHAVASGHLDIVELLLDHGAEPNGIGRWYDRSKDIGDLPCIYWALGHPEIFHFLLDRGADLLVPAVEASIQIDRSLHGIISISHEFESGGRAPTSTLIIQEALKNGCIEIVQILLERGIPLQTPG